MRAKCNTGGLEDYRVDANHCGVAFEWIQLNGTDLNRLLEAPDLRAAIENLANRMEPSHDYL